MIDYLPIIRELGSFGLLALMIWRNHEIQKDILVKLEEVLIEIRKIKT